MNQEISRRHVLKHSAAAGAVAALGPTILTRGADAASKKLVVGVMGLRRGWGHVKALLDIPDVEIAYLADVDKKILDGAMKKVAANKSVRSPQAVQDFRKILDDKKVDALFIAAPNFWHAPASILAMNAGKHVYVEKPGSHNPREAEWIVAAARKHRRVVQMGNQRRSWPIIIEMMEKLRGGAIGKVLCARAWYTNSRPSIGKGKPVEAPANLDYSLWQGPVPERPYVDNLVHYNWHWRWHWGNGEMGNNGVHTLDLARWGLGVDAPKRVTYGGGRYHFEDDQETPDTAVATFDFGHCFATWECSSCHGRKPETIETLRFYGDNGVLAMLGSAATVAEPQYKIYDLKGNEVGGNSGVGGDKVHIENFLNCIRNGKTPTSEIEEGQKSTMLCHLANIAYRTGRTVNYDAANKQIVGDAEAMKLWQREYRKGWEPKV